MLLTEDEFKKTMTSPFRNVTESADNFDPKLFDQYVCDHLVEDLGVMHISLVEETKDHKYRHVIFSTEKRNINYVVVIEILSLLKLKITTLSSYNCV